jgi:hypothetical protein
VRHPHDPGPLGAGADVLLDIDLDGRHVPIALEIKTRLDPDRLPQMRDRVTEDRSSMTRLLVVPRLGAAARARLRAAGVNHADLTGTLFLRAPGIRVDVIGRGRPPRLSARQQVNPLSKQASLVARALLAERGPGASVTELAKRLGLTKSWVSQVIAELTARLADPVALLRAWRLEYTWPAATAESFTLPFEHDELLERLPGVLDGARWALTLQSGAALLAPHVQYAGQVHLYVDRADREAAIERLDARLHAEPTPSGGNLRLLRPSDGQATFYDVRQRGAHLVVSPVQLFLDLADFSVRGAEAATVLAHSVLAKELALSPAEVKRLVGDLA